MNHRNLYPQLFILVLLIFVCPGICHGQTTTPSNLPGSTSDFLGWDNSATFPLRIKHENNVAASDIEFHTRNLFRGVMTDDGYLGWGTNAPASYLHIVSPDGNIFRTDGDELTNNVWVFRTGTIGGTMTERFMLMCVQDDDATNPDLIRFLSFDNGMRFETDNGGGGLTDIRLHIQGNSPSETINGFTMNTSGFVAISNNQNFWTSGLSAQTPYSLLHLAGSTTGNFQQQGYRPWMKDGIVFTTNNDFGYVGPRENGNVDVTDMCIAWSDNANANGPDCFSFRFTSGTGTGTGNTADLNGTDADGREIMRLYPNGNVGIGPRFNNNQRARSQLHLHSEMTPLSGIPQTWMQWSIDDITEPANTDVAATDGLRIGIRYANFQSAAYIQQYETAPIIFQSSNFSNGLGIAERMRITRVGNEPFAPGGLSPFTTRVAISSSGSAITRPRSVLHIGSDLSLNNGGWRPWMDVGTLTNDNGSVFVGVRVRESSSARDAVITWGRDAYIGESTPMPMRFIFTGQSITGSSQEAHHANGLEIMRMLTDGKIGIGNFSSTGPNATTPDVINAKLDIDGDLRIRDVQEDQELVKFLVIDPDDHNRVYWRDGEADDCHDWNAINNSGSDDVVMGYVGACNEGKTGIGTDIPDAKLHVSYDQSGMSSLAVGIQTDMEGGETINFGNWINLNVSTYDAGTVTYGNYTEVVGGDTKNVGGYFACASGPSGTEATGCMGVATTPNDTEFQIGVFGKASNGMINFGTEGEVICNDGGFASVGVFGDAKSTEPSVTYMQYQVGVRGRAEVDNGEGEQCGYRAIGVWGQITGDNVEACPDEMRYAGLFSGNVEVTGDLTVMGTAVLVSDQTLKTNIETLTPVLDRVMILNPVSYNWNTQVEPEFHPDTDIHHGFIAQEMAEVFPDVVKEVRTPGMIDDAGNETDPGNTYTGIKYTELIPIAIKAIQELNEKLEEQSASIADLEEQLNACCSIGGQRSESLGQHEPTQTLVLKNADHAILGFASPNPNDGDVFIEYYVPESTTGDIEMLFTDNSGHLINNLKLSQKGNGKVRVNTIDLSAGVYHYSLIVNGTIIATRSMIRQ